MIRRETDVARRHLLALLPGGMLFAFGARLIRAQPVAAGLMRTIKAQGGDFPGPAAALAAITDASASRRYRVMVAPGTYGDVEWRTKNFIDFTGTSRDACRFAGALPPDAPGPQIDKTSTLWLDSSTTLTALTITATNMRYAIHMETNNHAPDVVHQIIDCHVEHLGNSAAVNNHWQSQFAVGAGLSSGVRVVLKGSTFKAPRRAFSYHTNSGFSTPTSVSAEDCRFEATDPTGFAFQILPLGSGQRDLCRFDRCQFVGAIRYAAEPWLPTDLAHQPADHSEIEVSGSGNGPTLFINDDFGQALRISSVKTGVASSIKVDGDAVPLLFGDGQAPRLKVVPGSPGFHGAVYGWGDISGKGVGPAAQVRITSLAARLGNRTGSPRQLLVTVDGGEPDTIAFDRDFSGMDNDAIIAIIAQALTGKALVDTHAPGARYRPSFTDEEFAGRNSSAAGIPMGAAVARGAGGSIRAMTGSDSPRAFAGIAWEDIPVGATGRVKSRGLVPPRDLWRGDRGPVAQGSSFSVDPDTPGRLRSGGSQGLLRAQSPRALKVG